MHSLHLSLMPLRVKGLHGENVLNSDLLSATFSQLIGCSLSGSQGAPFHDPNSSRKKGKHNRYLPLFLPLPALLLPFDNLCTVPLFERKQFKYISIQFRLNNILRMHTEILLLTRFIVLFLLCRSLSASSLFGQQCFN